MVDISEARIAEILSKLTSDERKLVRLHFRERSIVNRKSVERIAETRLKHRLSEFLELLSPEQAKQLLAKLVMETAQL